MKEQFGNDFDKSKLKNHFKSYKKWYSEMKTLLNLGGFGWGEDKKMVTVETVVCNDYLEAHTVASLYKLKRMPDYFHLAEIFGDSVADGRVRFAANYPVQNFPPLDTLVRGEDEVDINAK
ncbi:L10-interacting MYB domain-containing protein [Cinnamomum micranthum f. kanehirae]|uniref:L10-interacting MYB domain-containing protein n=1 Tax=Cinnamomum micranthum f. kanehirae TaxID=337451 RepID=A0A3S3PT72_9MAGN|nr:L10-interacting MYB domain-containing protein [Cinnamomum micranthum f. kanehirae]